MRHRDNAVAGEAAANAERSSDPPPLRMPHLALTMSALFHRLRRFLGIDRAVGFAVLARGWSILIGPVTILFIAHFLTAREQGYYYTFYSLVTLQIVFELGFSFVILQLAAHETAQLQIARTGEISGPEAAHSRLASILQKAVRWYTAAAVLMAVTLLAVGTWLFTRRSYASGAPEWRFPWIFLVLAISLTFQMDPVFSFLEGCGFVAEVARLRFAQAVAGNLLGWTAFVVHRGLYAPAAVIAGQAIAGAIFLFSKRHLLIPLLRRGTHGGTVSWQTEIWPFQWRMAVSWIAASFVVPLFNPVLFAYRGPVIAGRMGMSVVIATALGQVAYAWMSTKAAPFGNMIARREFAVLDRIFFGTLARSTSVLFVGQTALFGAVLMAERIMPSLGPRLLPAPILIVLLLTTLLNHILFCEAVYLRAHKQEPLLIEAVTVSILTCASTILAARFWGAGAVAVGYFIFGGCVGSTFATIIFVTKRRRWHSSPAKVQPSVY